MNEQGSVPCMNARKGGSHRKRGVSRPEALFMMIAGIAIFAGGLYAIATLGSDTTESIEDPELSQIFTELRYRNERKRMLDRWAFIGSMQVPGNPDAFPVSDTVTLSVHPVQHSVSTVVIQHVEGGSPSWVVVHEAVNGDWTAVIGAKLLNVGEYSGTINLLRDMATDERHEYTAVLHRDDGDRAFDLARDVPYLRGTHDLVESRFVVREGGIQCLEDESYSSFENRCTESP